MTANVTKTMIVNICRGLPGCQKARGIAIVIDVFRASTTLCCLIRSAPKQIIIEQDINRLLKLRSTETFECFSEIESSAKHHDNSPLKALSLPLSKKRVCIVSRNGTVAINSLRHCERVFIGAFINADSLIEHLIALNPVEISLVPIGHINRNEDTIEDNLCAEMFRDRLLGKPTKEGEIRRALRKRILMRRLDSESPQGDHVEKDISLCAAIGILDVVPEVLYQHERIEVIESRRKYAQNRGKESA